MRKLFLYFLLALLPQLATNTSFAQTTLVPGDVIIVGLNSRIYNADTLSNSDEFAFAALRYIPAGTVIKFTDRAWVKNSTYPNGYFGNHATDGTIAYTVPAGGLAAGEIVRCLPQNLSSDFSTVVAGFNLGISGDQILIYQGTESAPNFIFSINYFVNYFGSATNSASISPTGTVLPNGLFARKAFGSTPAVNEDATAANLENSTLRPCSFILNAPYGLARTRSEWLTRAGYGYVQGSWSNGTPEADGTGTLPVNLDLLSNLAVEESKVEIGELAFLGVRSVENGAWDLAFTYLPNDPNKRLQPGTRIHITDKNWNFATNRFGEGEGVLTYTVPDWLEERDVVIYSEQIQNFQISGDFRLEATEQLYLHQGYAATGAQPVFGLQYGLPNYWPSLLNNSSIPCKVFLTEYRDQMFKTCDSLERPKTITAFRGIVCDASNWESEAFVPYNLKMGLAECLAVNKPGVVGLDCGTFPKVSNDGLNYPLLNPLDPVPTVPAPVHPPLTTEEANYLPNYVRTYTFVKDKQALGASFTYDWATLDIQTTDKVQASTQYIDGLGSPIQTVQHGASPLGHDIIQPIVYDAFGRENRKYLPYAQANTGAEKYRPNALQEQQNFYQNPVDGTISQTDYPYSETTFEPSPLNRVATQAAPGVSWVGRNLSTAMLQRFNAANTVPLFSVEENTAGEAIGLKVDAQQPYYNAGTLFLEETTNEEGNISRTYKDMSGQVLLKQLQKEGTSAFPVFLSTYYVYDELGRLRFVIPPLAVEAAVNGNMALKTLASLPHNLSINLTNSSDDWYFIYRYNYDERGRMISKYVPSQGDTFTGAIGETAETRYVYDRLDRVILSQDPKQREGATTQNPATWTCTKYDVLGRVIYTGLWAINSNHNNLRNNAAAATVMSERWDANDYTKNLSYPNVSSSFTPLTFHFYDKYVTHSTVKNSTIPTPLTGLAGSAPYQREDAFVTIGMKTASASRVLGSNDFLWSVNYYNDKGAPVQVFSNNIRGTDDHAAMEYDFTGKVLHTKETHNLSVANASQVRETKHSYDAMGRLTKLEQSLNYSPVWEQIGHYSYGALGVQKTKLLGLHQQLDYRYNERGWLTHINDPSSHTNLLGDYFAMKLSYDRDFTKVRHDGNITGTIWRSRRDKTLRAYGYHYDHLSRLTGADYANQPTIGLPWAATENENYSMQQVSYDDGGNITALRQSGLLKRGATPAQNVCGGLDRIKYAYDPYNPTRVTSINDHLVPFGASNDFRDDANGTSAVYQCNNNSSQDYEYQYDIAGNLIKDRNKGIDIRYNHLNLPVEVTLPHGGKETYTYSADGTKLRTQYNHDDTTKVKDYCGSWVYEENVLQYTLHSEGRTVRKASTGKWSYEYHIKDHLGNVRVTFRKKDDLDDEMGAGRYSATMETANAAQEDTTFENVSAVRHLDANKARTGTYSARLNASDNRPLGPSTWLAVNAHDTIVAEAFAHYVQPNTGGNLLTWASWLSLFAGVGQVSSGEGNYYQQVSPLLGLSLLAPLSGVLLNDNVPKAYLRYAYFDADSVYLSGGIQQISVAATSSWEALRLGLVAPQDGYVQIWVANESNTNVFFDDVSVSATSRYLVEELHYNPWGLELEGLTYSNSAYRYNGKEREARTSFLDYGARRYDKQVGRWWSVDPLADEPEQMDKSPYVAFWDNPIKYNDPDGKCPNCLTAAIGAGIGAVVGGGIEAGIQLYEQGEITDWKAVGGAALQGSITGGAAGFTGGASLLATVGTSAGANVIGGALNNAVQGKETTVKSVAIDAAVGVAAGVGGKILDKAISKVSGSASEMVPIYRGVNSTSPAFSAAENGVVKPRGGILGSSNPASHNAGNTSNSTLTSWTTNPEVATNYALRTSGNGVVLSQQVPASSLIASPNLKTVNLIQGGGRVSESEVLLKGTQRNLNVQRIGQ